MTEGSTDTSLRRTSTLLELGRYAEAAQEAGRYLAGDPHNARALCMLAQALLGTGEPARALHSARAAAASDPSAEWPHRLASIALQRLGRPSEAVREAGLAVEAAPLLAQPRVQYAHALLARGDDLHAARRAAAKAASLAPHLVEAHLAVGAVAFAQGRTADAEAAYRAALRLDPQSSAAHNDLARLHLRRTRGVNAFGLAAAASGFSTALRADPTAQVSRRNLDLVVFIALRRVSYATFVVGWIGHAMAGGTGVARGALWVPLCLMAVPLGFAAVFVGRLAPDMRHHLVRRLRTPALGLPVAAVAAATGLLAVGGALPAAALPCFNGAAALAFLLRLGLFMDGSRSGFVRFGRRRR